MGRLPPLHPWSSVLIGAPSVAHSSHESPAAVSVFSAAAGNNGAIESAECAARFRTRRTHGLKTRATRGVIRGTGFQPVRAMQVAGEAPHSRCVVRARPWSFAGASVSGVALLL